MNNEKDVEQVTTQLRTLTGQVRDVMETYPCTRDSDRELILMVLMEHYGIMMSDSIERVLMDSSLPSMESIRRCRQKIQETTPELRGISAVERRRLSSMQQGYLDYVRS